MKAAVVALWVAALGLILLVSIEGWKLETIHTQRAALQTAKNALEAKLTERFRNRRRMSAPLPRTTGQPGAITVSEPEFAVAAPLTWIRTAHLTDAGHATAKAAFESVLWAATQANVDALTGMISLTDADRKLVESFLAKLPYPSSEAYGTPEHLMALFMAEDPPAAIQLYSIEPALSGRSMVEGRLNVIALTQETNGQPGYLCYTFQKTDEGWRMVSPNLGGGGIQAYLARIATPDTPKPAPN